MMKKIVSILAIMALFVSMNVNAQQGPKQKKQKAKTEKACSPDEKKSCGTDKKGGCCSGTKSEEKKS